MVSTDMSDDDWTDFTLRAPRSKKGECQHGGDIHVGVKNNGLVICVGDECRSSGHWII